MKTILFFPKLEPNKDYHYVPYSLLAAAAPMQKDELILIDERVDDWYNLLEKYLPETKFFMCSVFTGYQLTRAYQISEWVKQNYSNVQIIWAGPHPTILPRQTLDSDIVDAVIQGHVDYTKPMPWGLIDIHKYINPTTERFMYLSSYGCPGHCTFCSNKCKRPWILLPFEKVETDIDNLMRLYPFKQCVMFDATVFTDKQRAKEINRIMLKHDLTWIADARACELYSVDVDYFKDFTGLQQLTVGLESGSQKVIDMMQKGRNHLKIYKKVAATMAKTNIHMVSGVIFGCPGETPEDIKQTIAYIKEIKQINPNFYISTTFFRPLPETLMSDMCKEYGYREPQTLEEWAIYGEQGHYKYNEWQDVTWIIEPDKYRSIYEEFRQNNQDLFI